MMSEMPCWVSCVCVYDKIETLLLFTEWARSPETGDIPLTRDIHPVGMARGVPAATKLADSKSWPPRLEECEHTGVNNLSFRIFGSYVVQKLASCIENERMSSYAVRMCV